MTGNISSSRSYQTVIEQLDLEKNEEGSKNSLSMNDTSTITKDFGPQPRNKVMSRTKKKVYSKVPLNNFVFWIMKIACTAVGQILLAYLSVGSLKFALYQKVVLFFPLLGLLLVVHRIILRYAAPIFWFAIFISSICGELISDSIYETTILKYWQEAIIFLAIFLLIIFFWWQTERTFDPTKVPHEGKREYIYWFAVVISCVVGSNIEKFLLIDVHLPSGYCTAIFCCLTAICFCLSLTNKPNLIIAAYWGAFIFTQAFALTGELLISTNEYNGIGAGELVSVLIFGGIFVLFYVYHIFTVQVLEIINEKLQPVQRKSKFRDSKDMKDKNKNPLEEFEMKQSLDSEYLDENFSMSRSRDNRSSDPSDSVDQNPLTQQENDKPRSPKRFNFINLGSRSSKSLNKWSTSSEHFDDLKRIPTNDYGSEPSHGIASQSIFSELDHWSASSRSVHEHGAERVTPPISPKGISSKSDFTRASSFTSAPVASTIFENSTNPDAVPNADPDGFDHHLNIADIVIEPGVNFMRQSGPNEIRGMNPYGSLMPSPHDGRRCYSSISTRPNSIQIQHPLPGFDGVVRTGSTYGNFL